MEIKYEYTFREKYLRKYFKNNKTTLLDENKSGEFINDQCAQKDILEWEI